MLETMRGKSSNGDGEFPHFRSAHPSSMLSLLALSLFAASASSLAIEGIARLPPTSAAAVGVGAAGVRVVLNGGERTTQTRADGRFSLDGLAAGVYLVELAAVPVIAAPGSSVPAAASGGASAAWVYSTFKVQLSEAGEGAQVLEYRYPGAPKLPARYPIDAAPVARAAFFEERASFSVWGLLKNPTVLMMLFMGVVAIGMPMMAVSGGMEVWSGRGGCWERHAHPARGRRLRNLHHCTLPTLSTHPQKNLDPETQREMEEQQAAMGGGDPMAMLANLLGGGAPPPPARAPALAPAPAAPRAGAAAGGGAVRRRPAAGGAVRG